MNVNAQKFQSLYAPVGNHWHESTIERHSLSQPLRAASSLREGAGMGCVPFDVPLGNRKIAGDFHRPYENSESFTFHHSTGYSLRREVSGDFHRPYGGPEYLTAQ